MPKHTKHIRPQMPTHTHPTSPLPLSVPPRPAILVVEDDIDLRETLVQLFAEEGYASVAETATMPEAFAHLHGTDLPHVVLLDFRFPNANADTLLGLVQRHAALQRHRFILLSGIDGTALPDEAQCLISTVCSEVVMKPFDLMTLTDAVKRAAAQLPSGSPN